MTEDARTDEARKTTQPKEPTNIRLLQSMVTRHATANAIPPERVLRWISFMVLSGALERLSDDTHGPAFVIKGGLTLELRLKLRARATKDIDAIYRHQHTDMLSALTKALAEPYGGFTFDPPTAGKSIGKAQQIFIRLYYKGRSWATAQLEISQPELADVEYETVGAISLSTFGLEGPASVSCLSLNYQIAQKIHAVTETPPPKPNGEARPNPRVRDLLDLFLLRELIIEPEQKSALRAACQATFAARGMHAWPPTITVSPAWPAEFARLARDNGVDEQDVNVAAQVMNDFIGEIAGS